MPRFELVSVEEIKNAPRMSESKRKKVEEYVGFINQLTDDKGGRLVCSDDENVMTVRNYLRTAAEIAGKRIKIRRSGKVLSFFIEKKRGGRRKKSEQL